MAGTPSLRSDPLVAERGEALAAILAAASGARAVKITGLERLDGGAIQENWGLDARFCGGRLAGEQRLVLRTDAPTGVPGSLGRVEEFAVLKAAHAAGVTVAEPLLACADPAVIGRPFFVMRRLPGSAIGRDIARNPALDPLLPGIAERLGRELARIQTICPPRADLVFLPTIGAADHIARFRAYLDRHPVPRPVLEWGIRWLETHIPPPTAPVLCHRDFRTGNYMLDGDKLTGILDWEFAGWGDPDEDIAWFCCKGWRHGRLDREAGGIADRDSFYRGYETEAGRRIDPERVFYWEVLANVRWAVIALQQSDRHIAGGARDLDLAITGRRATECELELLMLLDRPHGERSPLVMPGRDPGIYANGQSVGPFNEDGRAKPGHDGETGAAGGQPRLLALRDRPDGAALLELAREVLLDELLPLLPEAAWVKTRLVATCMAIAAREARAGAAPNAEIAAALRDLYSLPAGESRQRDTAGLLRRFARDLRTGAFETSESLEGAARAILWRLVVAKLREGNPGFLAANGFAAR